jgi:hypothetical protein
VICTRGTGVEILSVHLGPDNCIRDTYSFLAFFLIHINFIEILFSQGKYIFSYFVYLITLDFMAVT